MLAVCLIAVSAASPAEGAYAWPLDLPPVLTSSFGEYRPGRFHAGIDLRTNGIGRDVHAAAPGYISRVRVSPWGYGKAVYLKLRDGHTVVYAHLDDFAPDLRAYVREAQHQRRSYTVDLYPEPGRFPVQRGEVVAKSGRTGIGFPHLHYEIRDTAERPVNPRLLGVTWPDAVAPEIRKIVVVPDGPDSRVDGDLRPVVRTARRTAPGQYTCDPVYAAGSVGFGMDMIDPADGGAIKLGVRVLRTLCGDEERFATRMDRLSYENHRNAAVSYHPFLLDRGRFFVQWRWPGNVCEVYQESPGDGWFDVPGEPVEIRMEIEDFAGNQSVIAIPLRPEPANDEPSTSDVRKTSSEGASVSLACMGDWLIITASFSEPEEATPVLEIDAPPPASGGIFQRVDDHTFRAGYRPSDDTRWAVLGVCHPDLPLYERELVVFHRGDPARSVDFGALRLSVAPESPYGTLFTRVDMPPAVPPSRIRMLGRPYRLWPDATPIDTPVDVSLPIPEDAERPERLHLYRASGSHWYCQQGAKREDGRLVLATRDFGVFAVMEDDVPPTISDITPAEGATAESRRPRIRAHVSDVGSGVSDITVTCGDLWLLMEYDPEQGVITWERDEDLPPGLQEIIFSVTDAAANTATVSRTIRVPE